MRKLPSTFEQDGDDVQVVDFFTDSIADNSTDAQSKAESLSNALKDDPESFVTIHRILGAGNMPEQYCTRFPADKFDIGQIQQMLASDYGAGDYRIRIYIKGRVKGNKLLAIAGKIDNKKEVSQTGEAASILETVLNRMEANNRQMLQMLQQNAQPQDRSAMLQEMLLFKQLFSSDKPAQSGGLGQISETIELLRSLGMNVGHTLDQPKEEGFTDLIDKMSPLLEAAINSQNKPANPPQPKINPELARQNQMNLMQKMMLKAKLEPFLKAAAKNSDHVVYAEMLIDQVDEKTVLEYANNPNVLGELIKAEPRIAQFKPWFLDLLEHVRAMLGLPSKFSHLYDDDESAINDTSNLDESDNEPADL